MTQGFQILIYSISYLLLSVLLFFCKAKKGTRLQDENGPVANRQALILLHAGGILLLGIPSVYLLNHQLPEIVFGKSAPSYLQIAVTVFLAGLVLVIAGRIAEKKYRQAKDKKAATTSFSTGFVTNYFILRILFLVAYEISFRGFLLNFCIDNWGIMAAIIINIVLYTLVHIVFGKEEMLACIPFGLLLCGLSIWTGAIWPAIVVHMAMSLSYDVNFLRKANNSNVSFV
jgi:membrane protease YdiL (CAAX protease family)